MEAKDSEVGHSYSTPNGMVVTVMSKDSDKIVVKSEKTGNVVNVPLNYPLVGQVSKSEASAPSHANEPEKPMEEAAAANPQTQTQTATPTTPTTSPEAPKAAVATPTKERRGKKSTIIDDGLKTNLSTKEIVEKVLASFPGFPEKNIRNLVSVRRSKLKKQLQAK